MRGQRSGCAFLRSPAVRAAPCASPSSCPLPSVSSSVLPSVLQGTEMRPRRLSRMGAQPRRTATTPAQLGIPRDGVGTLPVPIRKQLSRLGASNAGGAAQSGRGVTQRGAVSCPSAQVSSPSRRGFPARRGRGGNRALPPVKGGILQRSRGDDSRPDRRNRIVPLR
jgi:hypothetical protein